MLSISVIGEPTCLANLTWLTAKIYYLGDNFVQNEYSVDEHGKPLLIVIATNTYTLFLIDFNNHL